MFVKPFNLSTGPVTAILTVFLNLIKNASKPNIAVKSLMILTSASSAKAAQGRYHLDMKRGYRA